MKAFDWIPSKTKQQHSFKPIVQYLVWGGESIIRNTEWC